MSLFVSSLKYVWSVAHANINIHATKSSLQPSSASKDEPLTINVDSSLIQSKSSTIILLSSCPSANKGPLINIDTSGANFIFTPGSSNTL